MQPIISIIVPIYNVEEYLERCLLSILSQSYKKFEVILVNDGSTDNSKNICEQYVTKHKNIFKLINKVNGGLSSARNAGIDLALGEYICFIDSDDYVDKDYLLILYNDLCLYNADISCCLYKRTSIDHEIGVIKKESIVLNGNEKLKQYLDKELYSAGGKLYRKYLFKTERFPEGKINEDIALNFRIFSIANVVVVNTSKLYFYFSRYGSITVTPFNIRKMDLIYAWDDVQYFARNFENEILQKINYRRNRAIFTLLGTIAKYGFDKNIGLNEREVIKESLLSEFIKGFWPLLVSNYTQFNRKLAMILFRINFDWCCIGGKYLRIVSKEIYLLGRGKEIE